MVKMLGKAWKKRVPYWLAEDGPERGIILSSRVRLGRNLHNIPFTSRATFSDLTEVQKRFVKIRSRIEGMNPSLYIETEKLPTFERRILAERQLIGVSSIENGSHKAILTRRDERASIILNEEDHLRLQSIHPGLQLDSALEIVEKIDIDLENYFKFAYSDRFGYLTTCLTNTGTAMRASILIHLPALVLTREIAKVFKALSHLGLTVRGFYGEGSDVMGNLFQVSNQVTLGASRGDIIANLDRAALKIIEYEKKARKFLVENAPDALEDKAWRGLGELKSARLLTWRDVVNISSVIRLGRNLNIFNKPDVSLINRILFFSQPAHLQVIAGRNLDSGSRDRFRADYIRRLLFRTPLS